MKCYAVIDTNVLVSALLAKHENSATVKVVNHLFDGTVIPVFSELILAEYGDVLRRKKFGFTPELVDTFLLLPQFNTCSSSGVFDRLLMKKEL